MVVYESPLKLVKTLGQLKDTFGEERPAAVCREISKLHETYHRGTLGELYEYFSLNQPKGEIVIIIGGKDRKVHSSPLSDLDN